MHSGEFVDTLADYIAIFVLVFVPGLLVYLFWMVHILPEKIAERRGHPQADAINVCGWMGILTLVLWPIAMVWAHISPGKSIAGTTAATKDDPSLIAKLQQMSQRLANIESRLPRNVTGG